MALRYSQEIKREQIAPWKLIIGILVFMLIINGGIRLLNGLSNAKLAGYMSLGIIGIIILVNVKLINHYLTAYQYTLSHNNLNFSRTLGKGTREVLRVSLEDIDSIVALSQLKNNKQLQKKVAKKYKFEIGRVKDKNHYRGYFRVKDKYHTFLFQPSDKMIEALVKELGEERVIQ